MLFNSSALLTIDPAEILVSNHYELPDHHFLTFSLLPDDLNPFDHCDCHGSIVWHAGDQRPPNMDGSAEVLNRRHSEKLWWQPYREGKRVYNSPKDRQMVLDLIEYGLQYAMLTLHGPARTSWNQVIIEIENASISGLEPFPEADHLQEIVKDLLSELANTLETA